MKKILIVDDSDFIIEKKLIPIIKSAADGKAEIIGVVCANAQEAIAAIKKHKPDLLSLDYTFEDNYKAETGKDVALWIDENYRDEIIVMTHTGRKRKRAKLLFSETKCVRCFIGDENRKRIIELFLKKHL